MNDKRDMSAAQLARILREARARGAPVSQVIEKGLAAMRGGRQQEAEPNHPPVQSAAPGKQDAAQLRKMIVALVQSGGKWPQLQALAWKLFHLEPGDRSAAHIVELCALHGTRTELLDLSSSLVEARHAFYFHLHPQVRERLALIAWIAGRFDMVSPQLLKSKDSPQLLPSERLILFLYLAGAKDPGPAYMYFKANRPAILEAARTSGPVIQTDLDDVVLMAARLAHDLGFDFDVRDLIRQISRESSRHADGVELLNQTVKEYRESAESSAGSTGDFEVRMSEGTWQQRIDYLNSRLDKIRNLASTRDPARARVNEALKDVTRFFPQVPEAWAQLSQLLVLHRDLAGMLPALNATFASQALVFHPPPLDAALWQGPVQVPPDFSDLQQAFWHSVALMHQYVAHGSGHEETLWKSRRLMNSVTAAAEFPLPLRWSDLLRSATQHVSRHAGMPPAERDTMLAQLGIAGETDSFSAHDIEVYLQKNARTPLVVLDELERIAAIKKAPQVQRLAILKKAAVSSMTNHDLDKVFQTSVQSGSGPASDDLCWRVASILSVRQSLHPSARHALEISGERRSFCPFLVPAFHDVETTILEGLSPLQAAFVRSVLRTGPRLPEMFSLLDSRARILKPVPSPAGTPQAAVDQAIKNLPWLGSSAKVYRFSHEQLVFGGLALPAFVRIAPANSWGLLFIMLAHRLGLQAWDCKVSRLANTCTEVIPRVAHLPEYKAQASKVARWLRDLSAEERLAWQELGTTCRAFTDQEGMDLLASVIARMAIMIHPDHQGALGALHQMRVDLPVLRNLEGWLLGPAYSDYRQTQNLLSRIMVPLNLRRLPGISVPSTSQ